MLFVLFQNAGDGAAGQVGVPCLVHVGLPAAALWAVVLRGPMGAPGRRALGGTNPAERYGEFLFASRVK